MAIRPILSSLRKHRIPTALIVLEIALACAVLCNAIFMIGQRLESIQLPNAIDQAGLSVIRVQGTDPKQAADDIPRNLAALRAIPGVRAATLMNTVPLSHNGWNTGFTTKPGSKGFDASYVNTAEYLVVPGAEKALGLHLLRGRFFRDSEYAAGKLGTSFMPTGHAAVVTQRYAERMWPGRSALGKVLYMGDSYSYTVVGVVGDVLRPNGSGASDSFYYSVFLPVAPSEASMNSYVVRSAPGDRDRVLRASIATLSRLSPEAVVKGQTFADIRNDYFADTRSMAWMLVLVCVVMVAVTAFGIVGLSSFWVGQRRRQIGIRRAVGATRADIMQYFQTENFLISSFGVVLGMVLAYGANLYLMQHYEIARMPWYYFPVGALALWLIGQLSVLGPALRAANVPPVVATRSV